MKKLPYHRLIREKRKTLLAMYDKACAIELSSALEDRWDWIGYQDRVLAALAYRYGLRE